MIQIAAGNNHSLFLKSDGSLWGMGENDYGQLGDGTYGTRPYVGTNGPERIMADSFHSGNGEFNECQTSVPTHLSSNPAVGARFALKKRKQIKNQPKRESPRQQRKKNHEKLNQTKSDN